VEAFVAGEWLAEGLGLLSPEAGAEAGAEEDHGAGDLGLIPTAVVFWTW
jgi:hypothetical protein